MSAAKKSITMPAEMFTAALARSKRMGYTNFSEYIQYLIQEDLKNKPSHTVLRVDPHAPADRSPK